MIESRGAGNEMNAAAARITWHYCPFLKKKSSPKNMFIDFRERETEKHFISCLPHMPHLGMELHPGYVPWRGMEPGTSWCAGRGSNQLSLTGQAGVLSYSTGSCHGKHSRFVSQYHHITCVVISITANTWVKRFLKTSPQLDISTARRPDGETSWCHDVIMSRHAC